MNNEIMKTEVNVPSTQKQSNSDSVLSSDFTIPKLLQMQPLSDWVTEGKASAGDFVRSSSVQILGGKAAPVDFIPLCFQNLWMLSENENGDGRTFEFKGYESRNSTNEYSDWEYVKGGLKCKRTKVMNLYALLPSDIKAQVAAMEAFKKTGEMPDLESALLPILIPFRNTSFKAAKEIATLKVKADTLATQMGVSVPIYGRTMRLSNYLEKNDKGSYFVMKVDAAGATSKEYMEVAKSWLKTIQEMGGSLKVDDSDVSVEKVDATVPF